MFKIGQKFEVVGDLSTANLYDDDQDLLNGMVLTVRSSSDLFSTFHVENEDNYVLAMPTKEFQELLDSGIIEEMI